MSTIKDIIDLIKELESRAKDKRDINLIHQIQTLALSLQSHDAELMEKNLKLVAENLDLQRQLTEAKGVHVETKLYGLDDKMP